MTATDLLRDTDALQVSSWCQYFGPPELASIFPASTLPAGCVMKPPGLLQMTLNSVKHLGLAPPVDFDIELIGTVEQVAPGLAAVVRWDVNQQVERDFLMPDGLAIRVSRVEGAVRPGVVLRSVPLEGTDCDGLTRTFPGWFAWFRSLNTPVTIGTDLTFYVAVNGAAKTVTLSWNLFQANFAEPLLVRPLPLEAIVVQILFGGRLDPSGIGLGPKGPSPLPPGPLPYRDALADSLIGLASAQLAWATRDPRARKRSQATVLEVVQDAVGRMQAAIGDPARSR